MQSPSNVEMESSGQQDPVDQNTTEPTIKMEIEEDSNENPLNGSMNELIGELDYEDDDVTGKQEIVCKSDDNADPDSEGGKLIVYCTSEEIGSPIVGNQSPMSDDKDEGEISDDDDEEDGDGELPDDEELEEGEVKEIPTATQQITKQVCRFFNNGNCTWGNQCRFLHLSLKDHGCYNMFGVPNNKAFIPHIPHINDILPIPLHHVPRNTRIEIHRPPPSKPPIPPPAQSAWDYGLQCVKEALEISSQRKKQEFDYEEKKMNLNTEDNERVADNKENYDYVKPYHPQSENFHANKYEDQKNNREKFQQSRNSWMKQEEPQGPFRRNKWRDKQLSEIQGPRSRGDEWRDPWRRSQSPKDRSRKRDLSSCSSISSGSYSTHSSSSPYSSRTSSVSSRSPSVDKAYHKNRNPEQNKRRKITPFHETRQVPTFKEKSPYARKVRRHSRSISRNRDNYRSCSLTSKSRSRSHSHSPSLSNVSSASSCSSSSRSRNCNVRKVVKVEAKPPTIKKPARPTRTLFEEMQRLVQHRQRADDERAETTAVACPTNTKPAVSENKAEPENPPEPEAEKPKTEQHAKSIGIRRIKLMKQLRAVEDAIARKRQKCSV